jgi:hypothetical protein
LTQQGFPGACLASQRTLALVEMIKALCASQTLVEPELSSFLCTFTELCARNTNMSLPTQK